MIAEKMTGEKSRDYMNARRVAKEYEATTRGLDRSFLSLPPCGSIEEIKQVMTSQWADVEGFLSLQNSKMNQIWIFISE